MSKHNSYSDIDLIAAVQASTSFAQVLVKLGLIPAGGNYRILQRKIKTLGLDISHFLGQGHNKGKTGKAFRGGVVRKSLEDILQKNSPYPSFKLRIRLLNAGILQPICSSCELKEWLTNPIPLELDHINGDHDDNRIENLRLLCPNCHALTPTYRGRKLKKNYASGGT